MDRLNPLAVSLHPVTKTWVYTIVALSVGTSMGMVSQSKLIFFPSRMLVEPWRLITSFCYFGPLQFALIQFIIIIARTSNSLEEQYIYQMEYLPHKCIIGFDKELKLELNEQFERRKTFDFAYFFAKIAFSIIATIAIFSRWYDITRDFFLLGPPLEKIVLYIVCRNTPAEYLDMMGISIRAKYMPFLMQFVEFLFSEQLKDFLKNVNKDVKGSVILFMKSTVIRQTLLVFTIGHFWWFIHFFYLKHVYGEFSTTNQEEWFKAHNSFRTGFPKWLDLPNICRYILTPPWYYFITRRILKDQEHRERLSEAVNEDILPEENQEDVPEEIDTENITEEFGSSGVSRRETESIESSTS